MRVLIVDEDPVVVERLPTPLRKEGYQVLQRSIVGDLPEFISAQGIDLVILEPALIPFNLSLDLCHAIQRETSAMLFLLSGHNSVADRIRALQAGADDYLAKPFDLDEILARVHALLRRHPLRIFEQGGGGGLW